jgi:hypothetical protein
MSIVEHPEESLSAFIDEELTPAEHDEVVAHLEQCSACAEVVQGEREVRALVRGLPMVEPPDGFFESLLAGGVAALEAPRLRPRGQKTKKSWRTSAIGIIGAAAAWVLVIGIANVDRHDQSSVAASDVLAQSASMIPRVGRAAPQTASPEEEKSAEEHGVPSRLDGTYRLAGFEVTDSRAQAVYTNGRQTLIVTVVPGQLDWNRLPEPQPVSVNGAPAWLVHYDDVDVLLVQRPEAVVVIVAPPTQASTAVAEDLEPEVPVDKSLAARFEAAGRDLLDTFGLQN